MPPSLPRLLTIAATLAAYGLARLLFNLAGIRTLGAETVGLVNLALSIAMLLALPASTGVAPALSRYMPIEGPGSPGAIACLRRWGARVTLASLAAAAALFLIFCAATYGRSARPVFVMAVLGWALLYSAWSISRAELFAIDAAPTALALEAAGFVLFTVSLLLLPRGATYAWLPFSLYYLPTVGRLIWTLRGRGVPGAPLPVPATELYRFGLFALLGSAASLGIVYLSTVAVAAGGGLAAAGLWSTLLSVVSPLLLAPRTLNTAFFPRLSALGRRDPGAFRRTSLVHHRISSLLGAGLVVPALIFAEPIVAMTTGGGAGPGLVTSWRLLCLASFALFRGEPIITAAAALGRTGLTAACAFLGAILCALVWAIRLPEGAIEGVALGYALFAATVPASLLLALFVASRRGAPGSVWLRARLEISPDHAADTIVSAAGGGSARWSETGALRRMLRAPWFAADALTGLAALLAIMGLLESAAAPALLLGLLAVVLVRGGLGLRREIVA